METFEVKIESLTGVTLTSSSSPSQENLSSFLNDGLREVGTRISLLKSLLNSVKLLQIAVMQVLL